MLASTFRQRRRGLGEAEAFEAAQTAVQQHDALVSAGIVNPNLEGENLARYIAKELARAYSYTAPTAKPVPNPIERLTQQLNTVNSVLKRRFGADDEGAIWTTNQLATQLVNLGVTNLLDIAAYNDPTISFWYDKRTGNLLAINAKNAGAIAADRFGALPVRYGRQKYSVYLKFTPEGIPVFIIPAPEDIGSDWVDFRTAVLFVASSVVFAIPGVGQAIGAAVLGPTLAATYPALAAAIGNIALSTALNGGDIQQAVTAYAASFVGAQAGAQVTAQTSSNIIGNVAAAATRAAITGGDLEKAVGSSLLQSGVSSIGSLLSPEPAAMDTGDDDFFSDDYSPDFGGDAGIPDDFSQYDWGSADLGQDFNMGTVDTAMPDLTGSAPVDDFYTDDNGVQYGLDSDGELTVIDFVDAQGIGYYTDSDGNLLVADVASGSDLGQTYGVPAYDPAQSTSGPTGPSGSVTTNTGQVLTNLALTALKLVGAWQQAGQPAIRSASATAMPNANGTITVRNPNGTVSTKQIPPGVPYLTATGSLVTNNGNGTYTTVTPSGQSVTTPYSGSAGSIMAGLPSWALPAGIGLAAVLLMRAR